METLLIFIIIALLALMGLIFFKGKGAETGFLKDFVEGTNQRLEKMEDRLTQGLGLSTKTMQEQFSQNKDIIREISGELTHIKETNKQVLNFSGKLENLEFILKNPKQRGILGEYFLENLLSNVFSENQYKMQYKMGDSTIADAVIFINDMIVPIDAKFSLEQFNKMTQEKDPSKRKELEKKFKSDIKQRIDETSKYIKQEFGTTDFAFMFIPSEGVFSSLHELGGDASLIEYAFRKHVIMVSPTSFYAYLETVLHGLKALKMEKSVKEIVKRVEVLGRHLEKYEEYFTKIGRHLETTVNTYNHAGKELNKIDKDVYKITDAQSGGNIRIAEISEKTQEMT